MSKTEELNTLLNFTKNAKISCKFDGNLVLQFLDYAAVHSREEITFHLKCGLNLTESDKSKKRSKGSKTLKAGKQAIHLSVKNMLQNTHYLGDEFYPAIIYRDTFDAFEAELQRRAEVLGRNNKKRVYSLI